MVISLETDWEHLASGIREFLIGRVRRSRGGVSKEAEHDAELLLERRGVAVKPSVFSLPGDALSGVFVRVLCGSGAMGRLLGRTFVKDMIRVALGVFRKQVTDLITIAVVVLVQLKCRIPDFV